MEVTCFFYVKEVISDKKMYMNVLKRRRIVRLKVKNKNYLISMISVGNIVEFLAYVAAWYQNGECIEMVENAVDHLYW